MTLVKSRILKTEQVNVWTSRDVVVPYWNVCSSRYSSPVKVEWDPSKTNLVSARLVVVKAVAQNDPVYMQIWLNGTRILAGSIYGGSLRWPKGTKGTEKSAIVDVLIPFRSGTNNFEVALCKDYLWLGKATALISAYLEYEFEGESPEAEINLWELIQEWLKKNWWTIPVATIAAVLTVPAVLQRRKT